MIVGRMSTNDFQLNDPSVSRRHASLTFRPPESDDDPPAGEWLIADLESSRGTWLNSVRLNTRHQYRIRGGDLIVIGPWTLVVVDPDLRSAPGTSPATIVDEDELGTLVAPIEPSAASASLPQPELQQLLDCSARIHEARNADEVIRALLDAVIVGTDFTRAAFLRPPGGDTTEMMASKGYAERELGSPTFSRTLIQEASGGAPARLQRGSMKATGAAGDDTVVALCVPVMAGTTLAGFVYLDKPSHQPRRKWTAGRVAALPAGLARLAGMGLANCMRIDIERRQSQNEAEMKIAAAVQRWLLPKRTGRLGPWAYSGETRQGKYIRGDFFDLVLRADGRLAVVVGDVLGRGIPVSVLVSATQGFLHARLEQCDGPADVVTALHEFYRARVEHSRFAKLWVGVLDAESGTLEYAMAGQGHAVVLESGGAVRNLSDDRYPLAGTKHQDTYGTSTSSVSSGDRLLVLSDGLINQRAGEPNDASITDAEFAETAGQPFGMERVIQRLQADGASPDVLPSIFDALTTHAGAEVLDDDATAVLIAR